MSRKYMEYEHVVYIAEKEGRTYLCIDRLLKSGRRDFMTHIELAKTSGEAEGFELMATTAEWLGNSTLIDSPSFRKHIGVEE